MTTSTSDPGYISTMSRDEQDRAGKIRMFVTGTYVNPFELRPEQVSIEDIGHHLSMVNRFTGGSPFPVSVAQHSVWVSHHVGDDPDLQLAGLLHDAPEAFINDLASPIKYNPRLEAYRELDVSITRVVYERFGLPFELLKRIKGADDKAFETEVASFYNPESLMSSEVVHEITWRQAKKRFMDRFDAIQARRAQSRAVAEQAAAAV